MWTFLSILNHLSFFPHGLLLNVAKVLDDHDVPIFAEHFQPGSYGLFSHNNAGGFVIRKIESYGRKIVDPRSIRSVAQRVTA